MGKWGQRDVPGALARGQRTMERWRGRQHRRARIPDELWREAAELAGVHGVHRTAKALRLNYYSLKRRVGAGAGPAESAAQFVELLPGGLGAGGRERTIELEDAGGVKMRIRLTGGDLDELAALCGALWKGRS